jgi:hypothetical protein
LKDITFRFKLILDHLCRYAAPLALAALQWDIGGQAIGSMGFSSLLWVSLGALLESRMTSFLRSLLTCSMACPCQRRGAPVEAKRLCKSAAGRMLVTDVNLKCEPGECVGLLGKAFFLCARYP